MNELLTMIIIAVCCAATVDVTIVTLLWKYYIKQYNLKPFIRMAKQYASTMGQKSQKVQHDAKQKVQNTQAKRAIAEGIFDDLPLGSTIKKALIRRNVPPEALFGLLQDKEFMAGVEVIAKGFGVATGKLSEMMQKKEREEPRQQRRNEPQQFGQLAL